MAKKPKYPPPTGPWWHPPADRLGAAGFRFDEVTSSWAWYSNPGHAGGYHVILYLHPTGWIFIVDTRYRLAAVPKLTTVPDGPGFTELISEYGWRRYPPQTAY